MKGDVLFFTAMGLMAGLFTGCEVSSLDSLSGVAISANGTAYDFSGTYTNPDGEGGNMLTPRGSGYGISSLTLMQYGMALEGWDSKGARWSGELSELTDGGVARFRLEGAKASGEGVEVVGKLTYGGDGIGRLSGTWVEGGGYRRIYGVATVAATRPSGGVVTVTPVEKVLRAGEEPVVLRARGGDGRGSYSWEVTEGSSVVEESGKRTGDSATYRWASSGRSVVTVRSSSGGSATCIIRCES